MGVDEAGRGALAGPVVAAAVCIEYYYPFLREVRDSKKLNVRKREELYHKIINADKIHHAVGSASVEEIDTINILEATYLAMHRAINALPLHPEHLYIDGPRFNGFQDIDMSCIINGDDTYVSIATASIIAKVHRDQILQDASVIYPEYGFDQHKGYGTSGHRMAMTDHGLSPMHRKSFKLKSHKR